MRYVSMHGVCVLWFIATNLERISSHYNLIFSPFSVDFNFKVYHKKTGNPINVRLKNVQWPSGVAKEKFSGYLVFTGQLTCQLPNDCRINIEHSALHLQDYQFLKQSILRSKLLYDRQINKGRIGCTPVHCIAGCPLRRHPVKSVFIRSGNGNSNGMPFLNQDRSWP